jgi:uncharacterized protein YqhQ
MQEIKFHQIAPAYLIAENIDARQLSALATVVFIIVVHTMMLLTPAFERYKFPRFGENNFIVNLFPHLLEIVIHIVMIFMTMPDDLGRVHQLLGWAL